MCMRERGERGGEEERRRGGVRGEVGAAACGRAIAALHVWAMSCDLMTVLHTLAMSKRLIPTKIFGVDAGIIQSF